MESFHCSAQRRTIILGMFGNITVRCIEHKVMVLERFIGSTFYLLTAQSAVSSSCS